MGEHHNVALTSESEGRGQLKVSAKPEHLVTLLTCMHSYKSFKVLFRNM